MAVAVRGRRDGDREACTRVLRAVHARDAYPLRWPDDPPEWLSPANSLGAWVAEDEDGDAVVGHAVLGTCEGEDGVACWTAATGLPQERIGVVERLFVLPGARGCGAGAALLRRVTVAARERGLWPALEVLDHNRGAVALYERAGWRLVGSEPAVWARGLVGASAEPRLLFYVTCA